MPKIETLMKRANYLVDDTFEIALILDLFNECLEDLSSSSGFAKTITFPLGANTGTIAIPKDLISIVLLKVIVGNKETVGKEVPIRDHDFSYEYPYSYTMFGDTLEIYPKPTEEYSVKIDYYGEITPIPSITTDPSLSYIIGIPERFHKALPLYAAYRYYENWEENPQMQSNFRQQYLEVKNQLDKELSLRKKKTRSNQVYLDSGWY